MMPDVHTEIPLLALKGVCLILVIGGYTAIGCHSLFGHDQFSFHV
jgi:hypothetical protein